MQLRRPKIWSPIRIHEDGFFESLVVAFADEGEAFILRTTSVLAGEIDGDGVPLKQFLAEVFCEFPDILRW